jgi:hypothetical protein
VGESEGAAQQGRNAVQDATTTATGLAEADGSSPESIMLEPTDAELDDWAERERKRRQEWLNGPSEEEKAEWARRERLRRLSQLSDEDREIVMADWARQMVRYPREMQLAAEGMMSLFYRWSRRQMTDFVRAGRDWEDQVAKSGRRIRIRIDDDEE